MSNIEVRKDGGSKPMARPESSWDPWRAMRALLAWDPFREMISMPSIDEPHFAAVVAFDVKETKEAYEFKADVPGMLEKDIEVTVTGNRLTVSGKRDAEKEDKSERYYAFERSYGAFTRSFTLPDGADLDKVRASLERGVLAISVPKLPQVQAKKIAIKTESSTAKS